MTITPPIMPILQSPLSAWQRHLWPWGMIGTAAVMFLLGTCCGSVVTFGVFRGPATSGTAAGERITLAQFKAMQSSMSYGEVVKILGRQGTRVVQAAGENETYYIWTNPDGSNIECAFNAVGELMISSCRQHGLR